MTTTDLERKLRIGLFTTVAGYTLLGSEPREAAELARAMFESDHLSKLDPATAEPLRRTADLVLAFAVSEYTSDPKGWNRLCPTGGEGVRTVRMLCYAEVARRLFEGESPGEIRSALRRTVSRVIDTLGTAPDAHKHELIWEIAADTIDRAIHVFRQVDAGEEPARQR